jgi:biopolymer transport protein ExbD
MAKIRHYKRHEVAPGNFVNLVPLIDIFMQIILFLMVMGSWNRANQIQLDLPKSTSTVKAGDKDTMEVTYLLQNGKPNIMLDSQVIATLGDLGSAMKASGAGKDKPVVNVRIEKAVPYQDVIALMDVVRDAGFPKFALLTLDTGSRAN